MAPMTTKVSRSHKICEKLKSWIFSSACAVLLELGECMRLILLECILLKISNRRHVAFASLHLGSFGVRLVGLTGINICRFCDKQARNDLAGSVPGLQECGSGVASSCR